MKTQNYIGLDLSNSKKLAEKLQSLLADYSVFYQNVRGYHWNIKGDKFFELHAKFEELYNDLFAKIDEIAERILTLGYEPEHKFSEYLRTSDIKESVQTSDGTKDVEEILNTLQVLIEKQRQILELSGEVDDEGTNSLMSDYIREQEKLAWMYKAFLG